MNCQQKAIAHGKNPPRFDETTRSQTKTSGLSFLTSSVFNLTLPRKSHGARKILVDFCLVRSLSVTISRVQENIDARQSEIAFSYDEAHAHKKTIRNEQNNSTNSLFAVRQMCSIEANIFWDILSVKTWEDHKRKNYQAPVAFTRHKNWWYSMAKPFLPRHANRNNDKNKRTKK